MFSVIRIEVRQVDQALATQLDALPRYEGQRPLRPNTLRALRHKLRMGIYTQATMAVAVLRYDQDREVLINGSHTVEVLKDLPPGESVPGTLTYYEARDPDELGRLYSQFDNGVGVRSAKDFAREKVTRLGRWKQWRPKTSEGLTAACYWLEHRGVTPLSREMRAETIGPEHIPVGDFIDRFMRDASARDLVDRMAVMAAIVATWRLAPEDAADFWPPVLTNDQLLPDTPQWRLNQYLTRYRTTAARQIAVRRRAQGAAVTLGAAALQADQWNACIAAWNAFRRGVKMTRPHPALQGGRIEHLQPV